MKSMALLCFVLHRADLGSVPCLVKDTVHTNKENIDRFLHMLVSFCDPNVKSLCMKRLAQLIEIKWTCLRLKVTSTIL